MKMLLCFVFMINCLSWPIQTNDIVEIRRLYGRAPIFKQDAVKLDKLLGSVDINALPLMFCYKGANEMIQARYTLSPIAKLEKFNRGKAWITTAIGRDTLDLEMRFIRFSIQSNLPSFLGYREDIGVDKKFILGHLADCPDTALKKMVINYLSSYGTLSPEELKRNDN